MGTGSLDLTRRDMLRGLAAAGAVTAAAMGWRDEGNVTAPVPALEEVRYEQVEVRGHLERGQQTLAGNILLGLKEDSLLKPFRQMAGRPSAGASLGGWYEWKPDFDYHHDDAGFAPASTFGQWTSALSRLSAGGTAAGESASAGSSPG